MDIKIRNKFIEIKNSISDWFVLDYLLQIIGGSEFWMYVGIDCDTDLSWNILGKSIKSIPLLMNGILMKCRI